MLGKSPYCISASSTLSHIEEIEDITDEYLEDELKALKSKLETGN